MHNKSLKYVRAIILTTLTVIGTASFSVLTNIKTLAQTPSVQSLEQQLESPPQPENTTPYIKETITESLIEKPPVICQILAIRNILSWKCPVQEEGNNSVEVPANVPEGGVNKKQNNPQIQIQNNR